MRSRIAWTVEHLLLVGVLILADAVEAQRLGGAATALVQRRDEAPACADSVLLFVVHDTLLTAGHHRLMPS